MPEEERRTITAIEEQVKRPERRSIFLDGEFALGADAEVVARAGLFVGQQLTFVELQALARAEERRAARDAALRQLGVRERSAKEVERFLLRKGYEPEVVTQVVEELCRRDLVDDARFAKTWVTAHTGKRPHGPDRLAAALRVRGVDRETVQEALESITPETELEMALQAGRRLTGGLERLHPREARRKLGAALRRRGFSWDSIGKVCDRLLNAGEGEDPPCES